MSTFQVSAKAAAFIIAQSPGVGLRLPDLNSGAPEAPIRQLTYTPDLSPADRAVLDRIVSLGKSLVDGITPAEWEALEPDIAGLVTYQGLASPTLAQTVLAVKAQSRILRALLRN